MSFPSIENLELVFTSKKVEEDSTEFIINAFILSDLGVVGKSVYQNRDNEFINILRINQAEKSKIWIQKQENSNIQFGDAFYVDKPIQITPEKDPRSPVYVFTGKNWKLAAHKKWKPDFRDVTNFEFVCEFELNNQLCDLYKDREIFIAKPK